MTIYVIKFDNGAYNQTGGFEVRLEEATRYASHEEAEDEALGLCGVAQIMNVAVHESHCCEHHGCKYGDEDCPVASGETQQLYPCEECREEDPKEKAMRELVRLVQDAVDLLDFEHNGAEDYEAIVRQMKPYLFRVKYPGRFK